MSDDETSQNTPDQSGARSTQFALDLFLLGVASMDIDERLDRICITVGALFVCVTVIVGVMPSSSMTVTVLAEIFWLIPRCFVF